MNKKSAEAKGLDFTGHYDWDKNKIKLAAEAIRAEGYKAYVVNVPPSPLSRGHHGMGYSVYTEPKYRLDRIAKTQQDIIAREQEKIDLAKKNAAAALENTLSEITKSTDDAKKWLSINGYNW